MTPKNSISVIINTLNEAANISKCIESVKGFADEVIVCDMYSDDNTVEIASNLGAKVIFHDRVSFVEPARFFAINEASGTWIFVLDADENLTPELRDDILKVIITDNDVDLIRMNKLYYYFNMFVKHGGFFKGKYPLFFKKSLYIDSYSPENSQIFKGFVNVSKASKHNVVLSNKSYILHYAYPDIEKFVIKTNGKYAAIEAKGLYENGKRFSVFKLLTVPTFVFVKKYILQFGFLEGINGFILCALYAQYKFIVWANLWQIEKKKNG